MIYSTARLSFTICGIFYSTLFYYNCFPISLALLCKVVNRSNLNSEQKREQYTRIFVYDAFLFTYVYRV
jgi:hypothetical protein